MPARSPLSSPLFASIPQALRGASQLGLATVELALLSFLAGASVLAAAVVSGAEFGAAEVEDAVRSGIETVSGTLFVKGSVVATADLSQTRVETIRISLHATGKLRGVNVDAASPDRMTVTFIDKSTYVADVPYDILWLNSDGDSLFEGSESAVLVLRLDLLGAAAPAIRPDGTWEVQVLPSAGGVIQLSRTMPPAFDRVMNLY